MFRKTRSLALILGAFAMFGLVACSGDDNGDSTPAPTATSEATSTEAPGEATSVDVTLGQPSELALEASPESAAAGSVSFEVTNSGALPHEFKVVKTDLAHDALPVDGAQVDESALDVVAASAELANGGTETVTADLEAGSYVLFCNVAGHYAGGMHIPFTVN